MESNILERIGALKERKKSADQDSEKAKWQAEEITKAWQKDYGTSDPDDIIALVKKKQKQFDKVEKQLGSLTTKLEKKLEKHNG